MLGVFIILLLGLYIAFLYTIFKKKEASSDLDKKTEVQVKKLWNIAQASMKEKKPIRAEKALLAILKVDEKNAAAYNRLYAKGQKYNEAIECFEIAQSLDNNASSLHNVGLIYLETGEFEKAAMAFRQAIELENDMPSRYIALAKAEEKMGNRKAALDALEKAYNLEQNVNTLRQILAIHETSGDAEAITATTARIEAKIAEDAKKKAEGKIKARRGLLYSRKMPRIKKPLLKRTSKKPVVTRSQVVVPSPRKTSNPTTTSLRKPSLKRNIRRKIQ